MPIIISITAFLAQANQVLANPQVQQIEQRSVAFYFSHLGIFKAVSILLSALFIAFTIYSMIRTGWLALRIDRVRDTVFKSDVPKKHSIRAWQGIKRHFFAGDEANLKLALLEADKVLNETLRLSGFQGETLGDRLKKVTEEELPNIQEVWEAHKLRNRLVHETDFKLNRDTAERALTIYEEAFKNLGLLD